MNLNDKRPHAYHRKKLIRQLMADGYHLQKAPKPEKTEPYALYNGPRPDDMFFETDLKRFHAGEAWYRVEDFSFKVNRLGTRAFHYYWPKSPAEIKYPLDEARNRFYTNLICGYEFEYGSKRHPQYGMCQLIDFTNRRSNTLRMVEAWPGCRPNGFAWDLILTINTMPLVAVVFGEKGKLLETAEMAMEEVLEDKCFATYLQLLIVTDGHVAYMGTPDDEPATFARWDNIHDDILSPDKLLHRLYYAVRPGNLDGTFITFTADQQQTMLVDRINYALEESRVQIHSSYQQSLGYVAAPSVENNERHPSPFGWMGAVRQMVIEQNVLLLRGNGIVDLQRGDTITNETRYAFLGEAMTDDECAKLMEQHRGVQFIRFIDRSEGPFLVDAKRFGSPICKFDHPIETLEYEAR